MPPSPATRSLGRDVAAARPADDLLEATHLRNRLLERLAGRPAVPTKIGRFEILRRRGSGSFGVVFEARDPKLDRVIAVKVVSGRPEQRAAIRREAEAAARVTHPNVIEVYDVGEIEHGVYIAMELVEGGTLAQWCAPPRSTAEIVAAYLQAAHGLAAAHAAGIVHRDFKPSNALVGRDGRVRVIDFGLAQRDDATTSESTGSRAVLARTRTAGTPAFMAPEQHRGALVDARSDQFAFCVGLWSALFGQHPFDGTDPDTIGVGTSHSLRDPGPGPRGVSRRVRRALVRGLSPDPAHRFESMTALAVVLRSQPGPAWTPIVVAAVACGGLITSLVSIPARTTTRCAPDREPLGGDTARTRMAEAVRAAGGTEVSVERVLARLDAGEQDWVQSYARTCRDHESGTLLGAAFDASIACLRAQLQNLRAEADAVAQIDADTLALGLAGLGALPSPEVCRSEAPTAPSSAVAPFVEAARARIARTNALRTAGRYTEAWELAETAMGTAEATGYGPVITAAHLALGQAAAAAHRPEGAAELRRAYEMALEIGDEHAEAAAAVDLVSTLGLIERDPDAARHWYRVAQAAVARIGDPPRLAADLANGDGAAQLAAGDPEAAGRAWTRAWELESRTLGPDHPRVASARTNVGVAVYAQGNFEAAQEHFEAARDVLIRSLGPEHPHVANALTNLGHVALRRGDAQQAHRLQARALAIREAALGPEHPDVAASAANLALVAKRLGHLDDAEQLLSRALQIQEAIHGDEHPAVADACTNLGAIAADRGDLEASAAYHRRARDIYVSVAGPIHPDSAMSAQNLASTHADRGDVEKAREYYLEAVTAMQALGTTQHPNYSIALADLAILELKVGEVETACGHAEAAVQSAEGPSDETSPTMGIASFALAQCQWERGARGQALALARRAQAMLATEGVENQRDVEEIAEWIARRAHARERATAEE